MAGLDEIRERARADLSRAQQREATAREALEAASSDKLRLESFLATLERYSGEASPKEEASKEEASRQPRTSARRTQQQRESKHGTLAIDELRVAGRPLEIGPLADAVEATGTAIGGGKRRNAYLASYLSKDPRLDYVKGSGWWSGELGERPMAEARGSAASEEAQESSIENERKPADLLSIGRYRAI